MPSFFLAFVAVFAASLGARDQLLVARQSAALGAGNGLLVTGWLTASFSSAVLAWAGESVAALLPASGKIMLTAFALGFASIALLWPVRIQRATEPTHSLGALALVLLAWQSRDAARFCVFALAAATGSAMLAGIGGALGGAAAITLGWMAGTSLEKRIPVRLIRCSLGIVAALCALYAGLSARGIVQ